MPIAISKSTPTKWEKYKNSTCQYDDSSQDDAMHGLPSVAGGVRKQQIIDVARTISVWGSCSDHA